jgi:hypothetical protein
MDHSFRQGAGFACNLQNLRTTHKTSGPPAKQFSGKFLVKEEDTADVLCVTQSGTLLAFSSTVDRN